jgi:hypothetical protein
MAIMDQLTTLYRPVNLAELKLIEASGWSKFPARLPEQPIFYPVTNKDYAMQIAKEWNVPAYGAGYVLAFDVDAGFLERYQVENVGGLIHNELWVSAKELDEFNDHLVGPVRVIREFFGE